MIGEAALSVTKVTKRAQEIDLAPLRFLIEASEHVWEDGKVKRSSKILAGRPRRTKPAVAEPALDKPNVTSGSGPKPWMRHAGKLKHLHEEAKRINQRIEEAFEQIDGETWSANSGPD
jgi:hypothetical protein